MTETTAVVPDTLRLNIGGGETIIEGYENVDRRFGKEAYPLIYPDNSVDEIRAVHVLEHFPFRQTDDVLKDWVRVLKPGGRIRISVPDVRKEAEEILNPTGRFDIQAVMVGAQVDENDYHKAKFDDVGLLIQMQRAGLIAIDRWQDNVHDTHLHPISLNLEGRKPTEGQANAANLRKIRGVLSCPRLGFNSASNSITQVVRAFGIDYHSMEGAFWGQCLERGIEDAIAAGAEWILTFDYDTVFSVSTVQALCMMLESNPDVGAIAPLQLKRGDDGPILNVESPTKDLSLLRGPLTDATLAHFGCTLIRADAIQKVPKPWFMPVPGPDGRWRDGRIDEDVAFWKKFVAAGNRLCVAPRVAVGHLQLMVTWPDEYVRPIHQHLHDWQQHGAPHNKRC